ncbi:hypothetical protein QLQ12_46415 [Actinoplanes sp. NEAU-A12]|uniref:DUF2690 domain-containing protein n=1 Tax=Actinoplanes sandaracinus TaxID=3045177 RepID=A0ABT6X2G6_9ACTN|nr:hypothetical protein [Actinoplanes sandaracinus]MDI6106025.1 hypothetical protein [Actinoplanes sandaracinus]
MSTKRAITYTFALAAVAAGGSFVSVSPAWASDPGGSQCTRQVAVSKGHMAGDHWIAKAKVRTNTCTGLIRAYIHCNRNPGTYYAFGNNVKANDTSVAQCKTGDSAWSWGYESKPGSSWIRYQTGNDPSRPS